MRITKRQIRRIIREESKAATKKYDDDSALRGDQDELPDALQKGIIDKTVDDREEKEKNESFRITKQQLRRIIREAILEEDKSGKGACPDTGCIKKSGDKWRIISNKTGKMWPQKYETKEKAENALKAYHVRN